MIDTIKKIAALLDKGEKRNAAILSLLTLFAGMMEAIGVASVFPFLSVLSDPQVIFENKYLSLIYKELSFNDTREFLIFLGSLVLIVVVFGITLKTLNQYALAKFTQMRSHSLSLRLLKHYLYQPYTWFLSRHSADLGKSILSEVGQVVGQVLIPLGQVFANAVVGLFLISLLLLVNPWVAILAGIFLGGSYLLIYTVFRRYLTYIGKDRIQANRERFQIVQEAFGGIKEVKAAGLEAGYISAFTEPSRRNSQRQVSNLILGQLPRYILEAVAFGGIIVLVLSLLAVKDWKLASVLPTIGVFAFAGQRLLPALQKVYNNLSNMRFGSAALDALYDDMISNGGITGVSNQNRLRKKTQSPIKLNRYIEFNNVTYSYSNSRQPALKKLNMRIPAKTTVGFVGPTGAGKTTAIDIVLGLLFPDSGQFLVDGNEITEANLAAWKLCSGYVPQQIFLADDTVAGNIAFGVTKEDINIDAVERAAKIAELHNFVINELSNGYETMVGERGVRLSGGQRQRIGIARALYHDPDVLILDEATSALDNLTEKAVMEAVHNLGYKKTIILIAHRLSTVKNCDTVFMLEHGELVAQGTYEELCEQNSRFQKMASD